jgi:prepilin-type N-terminal cleavage/methylation domain-containing protein
MIRLKNKEAFSLIEILIVVAIIGILAAIAIVFLSSHTDDARINVARTNLLSAASASSAYLLDHDNITSQDITDAIEENMPINAIEASPSGSSLETVFVNSFPSNGSLKIRVSDTQTCEITFTGKKQNNLSGC